MKARVIANLVAILLRSINPDDVKKLLDGLLDRVEDAYIGNPLVLNIVNLIRQSFDIPDNDDPISDTDPHIVAP